MKLKTAKRSLLRRISNRNLLASEADIDVALAEVLGATPYLISSNVALKAFNVLVHKCQLSQGPLRLSPQRKPKAGHLILVVEPSFGSLA